MPKPEKSYPKCSIRAAVVSDNRGFTLLELIMVCLIIGILTTLAIPSYNTMINTTKVSRAAEEIRGIEKDIAAYQADRGILPNLLDDLGRGPLNDPWGHPYVYYKIPAGGSPGQYKDFLTKPLNSDYDLYSQGVNNDTTKSLVDDASLDDIIRGGNGTFVGLGSAY